MIAMLAHPAATKRRHVLLAVALLTSLMSACSSEKGGEAESSEKTRMAASAGGAEPGQSAEQVFHVATLHLDGKTNVSAAGDHSAEPFPATGPKNSGGFIVKPPDAKGEWSVRAFAFHPAQVVVWQGDTVSLNFMGVQGPSHTIAVEGQRERLLLRRGEMKTVRFVAEQPGVIRFVSVGREPTMQGSVLVLPRNGG